MGTVAGGSTASSSLIVESTTGTGTSDYIAWRTAAQVERMRLLTGGALLINGTAAYGADGQLFEINTSANYGGAVLSAWSATGDHASYLAFKHSKSNTIGAHTSLASGDRLGAFAFQGSDGTAFRDAAYIKAFVDGTPGASDMPGRLEFHTTPDGSATSIEAMRIDSAQVVRLSGSTYTANGTVSTSGGNGTLTTASDERLKRVQGAYEPGLAEILKVKPIRYKWLPDIREAGVTPEHVYAGFSAQNVRDALGDLAVGQRPDGILSLQDRAILGALVNAVTELSAQNDALEARIAVLEKKK